MKSNFLKVFIFGVCVEVPWGLMGLACPPDKPCHPPTCQSPSSGGACPDPVFVISPKALWMNESKDEKGSFKGKEGEKVLNADEQRIAKALEGCKDGIAGKKLAWEAWKSEVGTPLQRYALMMARSLAGTTEDKQTMDFMLGALENPSAAQEKCFAEARGNGLEKKRAADQLAILLQNPNLKEWLK